MLGSIVSTSRRFSKNRFLLLLLGLGAAFEAVLLSLQLRLRLLESQTSQLPDKLRRLIAAVSTLSERLRLCGLNNLKKLLINLTKLYKFFRQ